MILSAHQPAYLPWLGYFDKIIRSDVFVILDNVQYEKNSFVNRNKIKSSNGAIWLTIPVKTKGHLDSTLAETQIDNSFNWKRKHLNAIYLNYKKAPRFTSLYTELEKSYNIETEFLIDLCLKNLRFWMKEIGIFTNIVRLSELPINTKKSELVADICNYFKATHYISGALGKDYLEQECFKMPIEIEFQDYQHPVYPQLWGSFIPNLSIVDFAMNTNAYSIISSSGLPSS